MSVKILEISNPAKLSLSSGCLQVDVCDKEKRWFPISELESVILNSPRISLSSALITSLAENNTSLISCNNKHIPVGAFFSSNHNHEQTKLIQKQISFFAKNHGLIWGEIVKAKISNQKDLLELLKLDNLAFSTLTEKVCEMDSTNIEAQAARKYWKLLFGASFKRNFTGFDYINSCLNYGYSIVRSGLSRHIVASGLLPNLGVYHSNSRNHFPLVDDLIEPFRPFVDRIVFSLCKANSIETLQSQSFSLVEKKELLNIINEKFVFFSKEIALNDIFQTYASSFKNVIIGQNLKFAYPKFF